MVEEMLKDSVRTLSYRNAIYQNSHIFANKVVLDVGCGTGILSMFCVKAGAKHVIGVDMSNIIDQAKKIVALNGMADKITLLKGKMEEVVLPFPKVDIIVSEWMGYFLLYESMLDTVLWARDRYLVTPPPPSLALFVCVSNRQAPGGLIFPDHASLYVAGIEDADYKEEKIGFWKSVYGFDFSPIATIAMREPLVDTVELKAVVTDPYRILNLNLTTCTVSDLTFLTDFKLRATRDDFIHAIVAWFDISFEACHKPVRFSTGPHAKYTHWKQTVFYLQEQMVINVRRSSPLFSGGELISVAG
jgi:type I protein arginine methyltransferase